MRARARVFQITVVALVLVMAIGAPNGGAAQQVTALRQAIAEGVAGNDALAAFYRDRDFAPIWTTSDAAERRRALLAALDGAEDHGLPVSRYDAEVLRAAFRAADSPYTRGQAEVLASRMFLQYARDVQSGLLEPTRIVSDIYKELPRRDPGEQLAQFVAANPHDFMRSLPPSHPEYVRLMREKLRLERVLGAGGWGAEVPGGTLEPGDSGEAVVALRNRLMAMGYIERSASASYDATLETAVQRFQEDHGLTVDGVAGASTIAEINIGPEVRLGQIILGMERQRWMNLDRGGRHIFVNIPDFNAYVIDDEIITFETRVVVGHRDADRHTPEFSDVMEHMVINPTWYVPRSITVGEYLPQMQRNPGAVSHLRLFNARGQQVSRAEVDFTQYTARTFPFDLRQPPSNSNALGLVKFMFPNRWNIYLHDTPARDLFSRTVRAYSHGCVRVQRPFELAYHLLAPQEADPEGFFQGHLRTGNETYVHLDEDIPVHLVYWTAWVTPEGRANYRADIYGRNAELWRAMQDAGVAVRAVNS